MFTVEMVHDETTATILDDYGYNEDVQFVIFDDVVYIRQWNEEIENFDIISMSPEMFDEFCKALNLPEDAYRTK